MNVRKKKRKYVKKMHHEKKKKKKKKKKELGIREKIIYTNIFSSRKKHQSSSYHLARSKAYQ
jgi:hypothetical protein